MNRYFTTIHRAVFTAAVLLASGTLLAFGQSGTGAGSTANTGVLVASVYAGSPADKAGILRGDIILTADGKAVNTVADLAGIVTGHKSGDALPLKIRHGDAERTVSVTLADQNGRAYLGIEPYGALQPFMGMRGFGGQAVPFTGQGAVVSRVLSGGPAEKAGLKAGDVIESVDGVKIDTQNDLAALIGKHKVGDAVILSVRSQGQQPRDIKVTLDKNPSGGNPYLGVEYSLVGGGPMMRGTPRFNRGGNGTLTSGVLVRTVADNSPAAKAGLKPRDLITAMDGVPVNTASAVEQAVSNHKPGDTVALTVFRFNENKETKITVTLGTAPQDSSGQGSGAQGGAYLGITMGRFRGYESPDDGSVMPMMRGPFNAPRMGRQGFGNGNPAAPPTQPPGI
jgi:S1-C subfamily serine protease